MHSQRACLVINPRDGQNLAKLPAILAVFSAAGWHTDVVLKEYGGHTMELATEAARKGYDIVIGYGGDGTLNQVVNGMMNGKKKKKSLVGVLPGGTANVWATEVSVPSDPVKAALTLVGSEARKADVGHVEVTTLTFLATTQGKEEQPPIQDTAGAMAQVRKVKYSAKARHHFMLMAGLGIDAAVMGQVDKTLKHRIGVLSVGIAAAEKLPEQHEFSVEISVTEKESGTERVWQGDALQVIIGNTRRYASILEMTSEASIDDGMLDVCVVMAGDPLSTMQQITSLLVRRRPDNQNTQFFRGAHLSIRIPASIGLQLDGSAVNLKDYLSKSDSEALQCDQDAEHVLVTYRFDALPGVLHVAVPSTYDGPLFERSHQEEMPQTSEQQRSVSADEKQPDTSSPSEQQSHEQSSIQLDRGRKVTVVGVATLSEKQWACIVAATTSKSSTGEIMPVAICIDEYTELSKRTGEPAAALDVQRLQEGAEIVVEGKKSKREVIHATRAVV
jgi:YegS/Rv2252/BmrU family lipid kinase